ncbi:thioredoxin domain-containing protein [Nannocystis sp. RBIL2]|uniref:DsbA family protein n=1 Tax=Nannocystis sp. RBIL2 TaxID=2996788 RepID=UPI00226E677A|nr:thioredoxin domain-containing protein [Nannocystis sp. RBIL2]MCY1066007.1 thioredoxin domain-containing protein [Nannocystis sp. RBIL2]
MKRISLPVFLVSALALAASPLTGCTGNRGGKKEEAAAAGPAAAGGGLVTMDQVDDSLTSKITGERFRVTYNDKDQVKGATDPLVTIVEFSDFQCPFCSKFTDMLNELIKDPAYANDVRVVFKQYPLPMHKDAAMGSEAALAAGEQGKFWEMHDILFKNQKAMTRADVEKYAEELKLDMAKFKATLDAKTFQAQVNEDMALGKKFGVRGTPSFFINGKWQRGAPRTIDGLKKLVDEEKAAAEQLIKDGSKRSEVYARIMKAAKDERKEPPPENKPKVGEPDPAANYAVPVDGRPAFGPADALVTVIEFSDFQCPFCNRVTPTLKQIKEKYPNDVRVVFRQLPLGFHDRARPAAKASLAAAQQGKFWEMHDLLFANQKALTDADFEGYARQIAGLNFDQWKKDLADPKLEQMIKEDEQTAQKFGSNGTPAFYVNGRHLSGAQPFEAFQKLIDEEKVKAEKFLAEKKPAKDKLYEEMIKGFETELKVPPPPPPADFKRREVATKNLAGKGNLKNPKITVVECSDFDCPFCKRGADTVAQIVKEYGDKVAVYFRNYPLPMHKMAEPAHRAGIAAQNQGKFWEMHDLLFADKTKRSDEDFKAYAQQLGLDLVKFERDYNDAATAQRVKDDMAECGKMEVRGAPGFLINGRLMSGAQPIDRFKAVFEEELNGGFEATQKKEKEAAAKGGAPAKAPAPTPAPAPAPAK